MEGSTSYFIEVSIEEQLKWLFAKEGFEEHLMFRFKSILKYVKAKRRNNYTVVFHDAD